MVVHRRRRTGVLSRGEKPPDRLTELSDAFLTDNLSTSDYVSVLEGRFAEREPQVHAFVPEAFDLFGRLRDELARLESTFPEPSCRPPLFGIPVGVKDIFHVEGFPTRAGSRLPPHVLGGQEARSVGILKSAGAVVLGKTVTTEFAYRAPGPTRNPHNLEHTPGGSSSGSAAAVAAGLCPMALGTQTIGSVLRPASYCGVVGYKPTYARIPVEGVIPLAPSVDHVGFFVRDVEGAVRVASVLCKSWMGERESPRLVLGVPEGPYLEKTDEQGLSYFRRTCDRLSEAGCEVRSIEMLMDFDEIMERHSTLIAAEAAMVHREWFEEHSEVCHEETARLIRRGQAIGSDLLEVSRNGRERLRAEIMETVKSRHLSALVAPTAVGSAPRGLGSTGDPVMNLPWTHAGLPAVSLPCGTLEGLPMGLQVVGPWMGDEALLNVARRISEVFDG